jgi:uncharacterized membrane protein (UPF0127 family)
MKRVYPVLVLALLLLIPCCRNNADVIQVKVGEHTLTAEVARTPEQRRQGLMNRKTLGKDRAMLFVFEKDQKLSFWMKDTSIPLSIAYIAKDGTIKEIHRMRPYSEKAVKSDHYVRYALEVNQGWFEKRGVEPGERVEFPEGLQ